MSSAGVARKTNSQRQLVAIQHNPAREVAPLLRREWPGLDTGLLVDVVDELRVSGLWDDIRIDRGGYDEWQAMLAEGGLIDAPVAYDTLVDSRPADAAVAAHATAGRSA